VTAPKLGQVVTVERFEVGRRRNITGRVVHVERWYDRYGVVVQVDGDGRELGMTPAGSATR
jgi:hypothetical protein